MTSHSNKKFGVLSLSSLFFLGGLFSFSIECWLFKPFSYLFSKLCKCIKIFLSRWILCKRKRCNKHWDQDSKIGDNISRHAFFLFFFFLSVFTLLVVSAGGWCDVWMNRNRTEDLDSLSAWIIALLCWIDTEVIIVIVLNTLRPVEWNPSCSYSSGKWRCRRTCFQDARKSHQLRNSGEVESDVNDVVILPALITQTTRLGCFSTVSFHAVPNSLLFFRFT